MEKRSAALIVVARTVEGNVRTMFDWRGALALGAGLGVAIALLGRHKKS
jgi:hypothetical protein